MLCFAAEMARIDDAREPQHIHAAVHAHLLFTRDDEVTIGQHFGDDGGYLAVEFIFAGRFAAALEIVVVTSFHGRAPGDLCCCGSTEQRERFDTADNAAVAVNVRPAVLAGLDFLENPDGDHVAHKARALVFQRRPVAGSMEQAARGRRCVARLGGCQHRRRGGQHVHGRGRVQGGAAGSEQGEGHGAGQSQEGVHRGAPYSWDSLASIWSDVWMALEFIS